LDDARPRESLGPAAMRGDEPPLFPGPFITRPEDGDLLPVSVAPHRGDAVAALVGAAAVHDHIHIEDSSWSKP
jgi:hypothetical protein